MRRRNESNRGQAQDRARPALAAAKARIQEIGDKGRSRRGSRALQRSTICVNAWLHLFAICRGRDPVEG
jgi:hypothetical protein